MRLVERVGLEKLGGQMDSILGRNALLATCHCCTQVVGKELELEVRVLVGQMELE